LPPPAHNEIVIKNQPPPPPIPLQHIKRKITLSPSLAIQQRKKNFKEKTNPLPLLLPHVQKKRKKNINLHPFPPQ
jgi:hypothetical protein